MVERIKANLGINVFGYELTEGLSSGEGKFIVRKNDKILESYFGEEYCLGGLQHKHVANNFCLDYEEIIGGGRFRWCSGEMLISEGSHKFGNLPARAVEEVAGGLRSYLEEKGFQVGRTDLEPFCAEPGDSNAKIWKELGYEV